jgi:hypothetical protein
MKMNRKAMVGFPIRLAVAFLILSISIPVLSGMTSDLQTDNHTQSTTAEAEKIVKGITKAYYAGTGSTYTIEINVDGSSYIAVGGEGGDAYSVGIFVDESETNRIFLQRPAVKIIGDPLELTGNLVLTLKCVNINGSYGVEVSVND